MPEVDTKGHMTMLHQSAQMPPFKTEDWKIVDKCKEKSISVFSNRKLRRKLTKQTPALLIKPTS